MIAVEDDVERPLRLNEPAQRIVSLVPSLTETLFALGCGERTIGITRYCTEPAALVTRIEHVGGTKNPDVARIRELDPDLILMNAEENRREDFQAFVDAGLNVFVSFPQHARDTAALLDKLATLTATQQAAIPLIRELETALVEAGTWRSERSVRVFCPIWKNPWMSFNHETYAHDLLALAGGLNVCGERAERYCSITLAEIAVTAPEVILLPDEPYVFRPKDRAALVPLGDTPACRSGRVHFIDGKALSWYGPRTASSLPYLRRLLTSG